MSVTFYCLVCVFVIPLQLLECHPEPLLDVKKIKNCCINTPKHIAICVYKVSTVIYSGIFQFQEYWCIQLTLDRSKCQGTTKMLTLIQYTHVCLHMYMYMHKHICAHVKCLLSFKQLHFNQGFPVVYCIRNRNESLRCIVHYLYIFQDFFITCIICTGEPDERPPWQEAIPLQRPLSLRTIFSVSCQWTPDQGSPFFDVHLCLNFRVFLKEGVHCPISVQDPLTDPYILWRWHVAARVV